MDHAESSSLGDPLLTQLNKLLQRVELCREGVIARRQADDCSGELECQRRHDAFRRWLAAPLRASSAPALSNITSLNTALSVPPAAVGVVLSNAYHERASEYERDLADFISSLGEAGGGASDRIMSSELAQHGAGVAQAIDKSLPFIRSEEPDPVEVGSVQEEPLPGLVGVDENIIQEAVDFEASGVIVPDEEDYAGIPLTSTADVLNPPKKGGRDALPHQPSTTRLRSIERIAVEWWEVIERPPGPGPEGLAKLHSINKTAMNKLRLLVELNAGGDTGDGVAPGEIGGSFPDLMVCMWSAPNFLVLRKMREKLSDEIRGEWPGKVRCFRYRRLLEDILYN